MELQQLRIFDAVVQANGFSRAERTLKIRQPTISKAIQALEAELGVTLLERSKTGVTLTTAGERFAVSCRAVLREVDQIRDWVEDERGDLRGDLRIATHEHVATYLLPKVIAELRAHSPGVVPRIVTGPSHLLVREIADGRSDLGLFLYAEKSAAVDRMELASIPCALIVAPDRRDDPEVLRTFIGSREIDDVSNRQFPTVEMLAKHRPGTSIKISCNALEAHKALVAAGCGISILPKFMTERELEAGTLERLHPEYVYQASLELVTKRSKALSRPAKAFVRALRAQLKALNAA